MTKHHTTWEHLVDYFSEEKGEKPLEIGLLEVTRSSTEQVTRALSMIDISDKKQSQELSQSSKKNGTGPEIIERIFLVDDLHPAVLKYLGYHLDIDPRLFLPHLKNTIHNHLQTLGQHDGSWDDRLLDMLEDFVLADIGDVIKDNNLSGEIPTHCFTIEIPFDHQRTMQKSFFDDDEDGEKIKLENRLPSSMQSRPNCRLTYQKDKVRILVAQRHATMTVLVFSNSKVPFCKFNVSKGMRSY